MQGTRFVNRLCTKCVDQTLPNNIIYVIFIMQFYVCIFLKQIRCQEQFRSRCILVQTCPFHSYSTTLGQRLYCFVIGQIFELNHFAYQKCLKSNNSLFEFTRLYVTFSSSQINSIKFKSLKITGVITKRPNHQIQTTKTTVTGHSGKENSLKSRRNKDQNQIVK